MRRYLLVSAVVIMISILMLVDMANAASPVTSGLKAWFKADALNLNDSDPVSTWTDSSGNSNNITQSTPSYRPVYYTNVLNGLPGVYFNGFFGRNSLENQDTATLASTQLTIFMVVAPSDYQIWGTPLAILSRAGGVIAPQQATIGWQENFARFTHYSGSTSGQSYLDHLDASTTNGVWNPCIVECTTNMQSANLMTYWNGIPSIDSVTLIGSLHIQQSTAVLSWDGSEAMVRILTAIYAKL